MAGLVTLVLVAVLAFADAEKLLRIDFRDDVEPKLLQKIVTEQNLDVWTITKDSADVEVSDSGEDQRNLTSTFSTKVVIEDVYKAINDEMTENSKVVERARRFRARPDITSYFAKYPEIASWMENLAAQNNFVYVEKIGKTYEGRDMRVIKLIVDGGARSQKPIVFITGGIHAREWLSTASVVYMVNKMVNLKKTGDARITKLLEKFDFYFSPVTNPDGYDHTHQSPYSRKWRKTKRPHGRCVGADPNRNFDIEFGKRGASTNPCHIIYPGPHSFSEDCTINLRNFALRSDIKGRMKLYYDVHAYGQLYFVPFAFDSRRPPSDDAELRRVASISRNALYQKNGRYFNIGSPGQLIYDASGSTMDWFKLRAGVKYSFAFEVFPNLYSSIGFLAQPQHIKPSGEEITAAILRAAEVIKV